MERKESETSRDWERQQERRKRRSNDMVLELDQTKGHVMERGGTRKG